MSYPLPLTRTEAYLAYKAGVIQQSELKPSLAVPRNGIDAWLAYWTGLAADYPKREDGTPHILQEEEAYIAYLCGVINEYPEKCLRRVGAYLRYIISARWGRPDHPLNREELYLSLIKTQFIPSGDPSSDITINGTAKAAFVDVKMYGDTFQQGYEGKNLFNPAAYANVLGNNAVRTLGVDGSITWVNTTSDSYFPWIYSDSMFGTAAIRSATIPVQPSKQYTVSFKKTTATAAGLYVYEGDSDYVGIKNTYTTILEETSYTFTTSETTRYVILRFAKWASQETDVLSEIQLEAGSTVTSFEPFVGGTPSPNPDYPQAIQTVTGEQMVEVQGKNLLKLNDGTTTLGGVPITTANGTVNLNGTATSGAQGYYVTLGITASEPMVFSTNKSGTTSGLDIKLQYKRGGTTYYPTVGSSLSLQAGDIIQQMYLIVANGSDLNGSFSPMLEKGSTKTSFEPYSKHTHEINLGKNLCSSAWEAGTYNTVTGSKSSGGGYRTADYVEVEPNTTYIISRDSAGVAMNVLEYNANKTFTYYKGDSIFSGSSFTTRADTRYITMYSGTSGGIANMMLEKGTTITTYAPYFTPIELCKLDTYQDYIYKSGDDWKVHKAIKTKVLNGSDSEDWTALTYGGYTYELQTALPAPNSPSKLLVLSGYFFGIPYDNRTQNIPNSIYLSDTGRKINIRNTAWTTVGQFKTWLASNNTTVYYALETPTDTTITDTNLIAQLDSLVSGGAENGTTYIKVSATDPNLPAKLYVEAPKYD